ncbi:mRNA export factor GLE1 isoform X2 [Impatiens glandulifera]|uniref:mRNA export factor GLE1 isoform X2 n=1 Tax=Impatiens glandulifera TaxID=253017 RepID=UPI001FB16A60|nr:mRNA export factor GLE1 isoform X2 [Impatiens glandulifera]
MGPTVVKLELPCPSTVGNIALDPQPDWSFDSLLSELNSIEQKLKTSPLSFTKTQPRIISTSKCFQRRPASFVMRVDELEDEHPHMHSTLVKAQGFAAGESYFSDSDNSEDELSASNQLQLMDKVSLAEGELAELIDEKRLFIADDLRSQIVALESHLMNENKKLASALIQVEKNFEGRRELDRKLDMQYQRNVAEALDNHLTAVQRNHEHKSQIEERKIRNDAAIEDAKRREKAMQEERLRQETSKAEAEAKLAEKKRAEEAKTAALVAAEKAASTAATKSKSEAIQQQMVMHHLANITKQSQAAGTVIKGAESGLNLEERRINLLKDIADKNKAQGLGSTKDYLSHVSKIQRVLKQITGTKENVRKKVEELVKVFSDPSCPHTISIATFAEKMVFQCSNPNQLWFAYAHVAVVIASKVPISMDLLLAELNRVCIFTVPKFISYSKLAFNTKEDYCKAIGYKELEGGVLESEEDFVSRMELCMKFYGAVVQTEIEGVENIHGLKDGWAWVARFLNSLPANVYTALALQAFLEVAGFGLHRKYKSQFVKLLNIISGKFVSALKKKREGGGGGGGGEDVKMSKVVSNMETYIGSKKFLEEPVGRSFKTTLASHDFVPELENHNNFYGGHSQNYSNSNSRYFY